VNEKIAARTISASAADVSTATILAPDLHVPGPQNRAVSTSARGMSTVSDADYRSDFLLLAQLGMDIAYVKRHREASTHESTEQ